MLIHRRKVGEALRIGDSVEIRIISVGKKVVLGIIAPREVSVVACRVSGAAMDNTIAASLSADMDRKLRAASRKATPVILSLQQEAPKTPPKVSDND